MPLIAVYCPNKIIRLRHGPGQLIIVRPAGNTELHDCRHLAVEIYFSLHGCRPLFNQIRKEIVPFISLGSEYFKLFPE